MQSQGYRIIPVNPQIESALGETAYPDLDSAFDAIPENRRLSMSFAPRNMFPPL